MVAIPESYVYIYSKVPDSTPALRVKWQMGKRREEGSGGGERRTEEIGEDRRGEAKDRMKSLLKNLCVCVGEGGVAMVRPRQ